MSSSKRAISHEGVCAVLYRNTTDFFCFSWTIHDRKIRNVEKQEGVFIFHSNLSSFGGLVFSRNFNTFFQDFYSPGGSQSGGHVSIYFIYYLQFPSKMAVLFKNYPNEYILHQTFYFPEFHDIWHHVSWNQIANCLNKKI